MSTDVPTVRVRYQTLEFDGVDIHVRSLRSKQEFLDDGVAEGLGVSPASWPLFGVVWDASQILAHLMMDHDIDGLRVLEVGCGLALASLILSHRNADITATDYNPDAGQFLTENLALNAGGGVDFERADWADDNAELGQFDLIIGSDVLYEPDHAELLANFVARRGSPSCKVIIVDAGRGHRSKFMGKMVAHGFEAEQYKPGNQGYLDNPFKGDVLTFTRAA
ncbi:MAG: putative nicotinamide N-methyase [Myxococcota bacterium]|jgi:predicted nicotinamide N-methyase